MVNGNEYGSSSIINDGVVSIPWVIPTAGESVDLEIDIQPLRGQSVVYEVENSITFRYDSVNPQLLSMNVDQFDHFQSSPDNRLEFVITDRPFLPTQAKIALWHSWENDFNQNGQIDSTEVVYHDLLYPSDLTQLEGTYSFPLDTSSAPDGSYVQGWLEVADSAGNEMFDSGNLSSCYMNIFIFGSIYHS